MALFRGTPADDVFTGTARDDYFFGDLGNDRLSGADGNDIVRGSFGDDFLEGGRGADVLDGNDGNDTLYGGAHYDILCGSKGNDRLDGGDGGDVLDGGEGADSLAGGPGGDRFVFDSLADSRPGSRDVIVDFDPGGGDVIDLSSIDAKAGVAGGQGFVFIGAGPFTGEGQVRAYRDAGRNFVEVNTSGAGRAEMVIELAGAGLPNADSFVLTGGVNDDDARDQVITGTLGDDILIGRGGSDYLYGDVGPDVFNGGADRLSGGADIDILRGGIGADSLDGGPGPDSLDGGQDNNVDTFWFMGKFDNDIVKDFRPGKDVLAFNVPGVDGREDLTFSKKLITVGDWGSVSLSADTSKIGANSLRFFDGLNYIASHDDLIAAFGPNPARGARHFELNGFDEGRSPGDFDAAQYLANYDDLQAAFGSNTEAATMHYIRHGFSEGRTDEPLL